MNECVITISGNIASEIRAAVTQTGVDVASFRLASSIRRFDRVRNEWVDGHTNFFTVVCWRTLANNVTSSCGIGDPVVVHGRLRVKRWERDDRSGTTVEVEASAVGHDLNRGTSAFLRNAKALTDDAGRDVVADLTSSFRSEDTRSPDTQSPAA